MSVVRPIMSEMQADIPEQCRQRNEDVLFYCKTKTVDAPIRAHLPSVMSLGFQFGYNVYFFDEELNAEKNNITILAAEGDRINGKNQIVLNKNGMGAMIIPMGKNDWKAVVFD